MNPLLETIDVNFLLSFVAGILAFFSPCTFPLLPSFIALITNLSTEELINNDKNFKKLFNILIPIIFFGIGFSIIFILLGASSTIIGKFLIKYKKFYTIFSSIIIIILGFFLSGILNIEFLNREKRIHIKKNGYKNFVAFFYGITFAFGWSPCIGPILASILIIASNYQQVYKGILLLLSFSFAYILMFLIFGLIIFFTFNLIKKINKYIKTIKLVSSLIFIIYGFYLLFSSIF